MERALRHPAGDPALRQPRRRPLRPAPRHQLRHPRRRRPTFDESAPALERHDGPGRRRLGAALRHGGRLPVDVEAARDPGHRGLPGQLVPHRALAARGCRLHRPARRRDRHRVVGHPVDPDHRRAGSRADGVPADAELQPAGEERAARSRRDRKRSRRATPSTVRRPASVGVRRAQSAAREVGARGRPRTSAKPRYEEGFEEGSLVGMLLVVQRPHHRQGGQRHGRRVRAQTHPPDRRGSRSRRERCARPTTRSEPSGRASTPTTTRRTTVPNVAARQPPQDAAGRGHRERRPHVRTRSTSSTASCSPPASTP